MQRRPPQPRTRGQAQLNQPNQAFIDLLDGEQAFLLAGHEHPDGDCLGSQVALYHLLKALGKRVRICNPDPPARSHEFLREHTPIGHFDASDEPSDYAVLVLLDCAEVSRLGRMRSFVERWRPRVAIIDHHVGSELAPADAHYVDRTAAATGVLVHALFEHYGVEVERPAAEAMFLSLVADTGWFRYSNSTPEVFALAAKLLETGFDASVFYDRLYRRNDAESVSFLAEALARSSIGLGGRFGHVVVDRPSVEKASAIGFDLDSIMEPLRSVEGVEVVAMFKESFDGAVKLSLRSAGPVDVQAIARRFGGGGHTKAAGASIQGPIGEVFEKIEREVAAALDRCAVSDSS
jgi:phosphoesterase RecJ-like protein